MQNIKFYDLQKILTCLDFITLCYFHCLATSEVKPHTKQSGDAHITHIHHSMALKNHYVITKLPPYFSSWETWKH